MPVFLELLAAVSGKAFMRYLGYTLNAGMVIYWVWVLILWRREAAPERRMVIISGLLAAVVTWNNWRDYGFAL